MSTRILKSKTTNIKNNTNKHRKHRSYCNKNLPELDLTVIPKPTIIQTVDSFDELKALPHLTNRISIIIQKMKTLDTKYYLFFEEVDIADYKSVIENPIHFTDILNKINQQKYNTFGQILSDIKLLFDNCWTFNGRPDPLNNYFEFSNFASGFQSKLHRYINQYKKELIVKKYLNISVKNKKNKNIKLTFDIDWEIPSKPYVIGSVSSFDKIIAFPKLTVNICKILNKIKLHDPSLHFFKDSTTISDYSQQINDPMHFGLILEKIKNRQYKTMGDVKNDIDLVWSNCYEYNGEPSIKNPFSNWAQDLKYKLDRYMDEFVRMLKNYGYIKQKCKKRNRLDLNDGKMTDCMHTSIEPNAKKQKIVICLTDNH
eukprot:96496_1